MSKLPQVFGAEAVKALGRLGFTENRQKGSHVILRRGSVGCVVPLHSELKDGRWQAYCARHELLPKSSWALCERVSQRVRRADHRQRDQQIDVRQEASDLIVAKLVHEFERDQRKCGAMWQQRHPDRIRSPGRAENCSPRRVESEVTSPIVLRC